MTYTGEAPVRAMLAAYGLADAPFESLRNRDSDKPAFRIGDPPRFLLKAESHQIALRLRLQDAFRWMPKLVKSACSDVASGNWTLSTWMPGIAGESLSPHQCRAAAAAIAELHRRILTVSTTVVTADAVRQRLQYVNRQIGGQPVCGLESLPIPLEPPAHAQFIHGDLHGEHILFEGDVVSGVIDWSNIKTDHPAVDMARYFGTWPETIPEAVEVYRAAGGDESVTADLVRLLARTIAVGAVLHWRKRNPDHPRARRFAEQLRSGVV